MIETMVVVCDGCGKKCFTSGSKLPDTWRSLRWTPGIIVRPDASPPLPAGRYDFCTPECFQSFKENGR